ncbi:MAG: prepilin-type N-terminal cleavage/methylation domain-containing protein [Actinomycetota bacterium]|nr:prepilin-type N-terminal cleavage/methylation domain-containing protein [Actinomycetota bacterium]MDP3630374.1 prepilin-type N-terminal cleavage/methylation domain-containing protein [Actinomycetota bacterium]
MGTFWKERRESRRDGGFTIVELMVVVLILGVLLLIAVASYQALTERAAEAACISNQRTLNGAIQIYRGTSGSLATTFTLDDLEGYANTWDIITVCPLDGAPLVYDDVSESIICPNHPFD